MSSGTLDPYKQVYLNPLMGLKSPDSHQTMVKPNYTDDNSQEAEIRKKANCELLQLVKSVKAHYIVTYIVYVIIVT